MSGAYVHDGRRPGHRSWTIDAIAAGVAGGAFVSPFSTPRFTVPRYVSGLDFARSAAGAGGEVIFDALTHARLLPGSNRTDLYDSWELWGSAGIGIDLPLRQQQHVERVFTRQTELGVPLLAPTVSLDSAVSADATHALEMAWLARGIESTAWQTLAGSRAFWRSGSALDAHVGSIAELRAPVWVLAVTNEMVLDQVPDLADHDAFEGLLRTVHSLSERSRVIVTYSDFSGLLSVAAGADTIGAGWDRAMRTMDPASFHIDSDPGIRIPASYVTQGGLAAVLRRDAAEAIQRWNAAEALRIRGGSMPPNDQAERLHHLSALSSISRAIDSAPNRLARVATLRSHYETASRDFDTLIGAVGPSVRQADKNSWNAHHLAVLESYARAEALWT